MDRLEKRNAFKTQLEKMHEKQKKIGRKKLEARKKIEKYVKEKGDKELEKLWDEYENPIDNILSSTFKFVELSMVNLMGNIEKSFTHLNYKCECGEILVPDGNYKEGTEGTMQEEFETIKNQFVCLTCGKKYKLTKIE